MCRFQSITKVILLLHLATYLYKTKYYVRSLKSCFQNLQSNMVPRIPELQWRTTFLYIWTQLHPFDCLDT